MKKMINININGQTAQIESGAYLMPALKAQGIELPTLCQHKDLDPVGSCRLCLVEVEEKGVKRLVTSCDYKVTEEVNVASDSPRALKQRKMLAEMYLGRWPQVRTVQRIAKHYGLEKSRFTSELTDENVNACVLCTRCVRACKQFTLEEIIHFSGRGYGRHLTMPFHEPDQHCVSCTSCSYVCPTAAISIVDDRNHPVDPKKIRNAGMRVNAEMSMLDRKQCRMREVGTANIVDVMAKYDLLPCHNFKYGTHKDAHKIGAKVLKEKYLAQNSNDGCWPGCSMACAKVAEGFVLKTGPYKGEVVIVDGPEYETCGACATMGCFDPEFVLEFNFYCDTYGIDTISCGTMIGFIMECYENKIITPKYTGGLKLNFGACGEVLKLLHLMAQGKGFGKIAGLGTRQMKERFIKDCGADPAFLKDIGMEVKGLEYSEYMSKESLAQQGGYALTNKGPQHDEAWLIFMDMVNKQLPTFNDKAEALYYFPLWRTWFGLYGLCKLCWNDVVPADNHTTKEPAKIPGHVHGYFQFVEGMTGRKLDEAAMLNESARVYNLQRVMSFMFGKGSREHDMPPYRSVGPVTVEEYQSRAERYDKQMKEEIGVDPTGKSVEEKVAITRKHREEQFKKLQDVVYARRGWTNNGVPKLERLKELGIDFPKVVEIVKDHQG